MKQTTEEKILDYLNDMDDSDFNTLAEEYLEENSYFDDIYHSMDEFDSFMEGKTPSDIAITLACASSDFNINDEYFRFDGYGNPVSANEFCYRDDINMSDFVNWLMDGNGSPDSDLQDIIDGEDEEEEAAE
jgi:hypothetical protein